MIRVEYIRFLQTLIAEGIPADVRKSPTLCCSIWIP